MGKANYYRIKQVDIDGRYSYSPIRLVNFSSGNVFTVTPNPATDNINVYSDSKTDLTIAVYDVMGKKLATKVTNNGNVQFNISGFAKGVYIVAAESNGVKIQTTRIVKQ